VKLVISSDHAGFPLKEELRASLAKAGHEIVDLGAFNTESSDYPDFAEKIGAAIKQGVAARGILICGSGVGACIAANKIPGIRAGICHDCYSAHQGVEHDDMNVLVLGRALLAERWRTSWRCSLSAQSSSHRNRAIRAGSRRSPRSKQSTCAVTDRSRTPDCMRSDFRPFAGGRRLRPIPKQASSTIHPCNAH